MNRRKRDENYSYKAEEDEHSRKSMPTDNNAVKMIFRRLNLFVFKLFDYDNKIVK